MEIFALFPGQGSQRVGMGADLRSSEALARELFDRADACLPFKLSEVCLNGPEDRLTAEAKNQIAKLEKM